MVSDVPRPVLERLARLHLQCGEWERTGRETFTSREAARYLDATAATVRKDLNWLGSIRPGAAYRVAEVRVLLEGLLQTALHRPRACLIGLGPLGLGLWDTLKNRPDGWDFKAAFDSRLNRLEQLDLEIPLYPSTEIAAVVRREGIETAVLATSADEAQKIADRLVLGGIKAILNLTPVLIRVNKAVEVRQTSVELEMTMIQTLLNRGREGEKNG